MVILPGFFAGQGVGVRKVFGTFMTDPGVRKAPFPPPRSEDQLTI